MRLAYNDKKSAWEFLRGPVTVAKTVRVHSYESCEYGDVVLIQWADRVSVLRTVEQGVVHTSISNECIDEILKLRQSPTLGELHKTKAGDGSAREFVPPPLCKVNVWLKGKPKCGRTAVYRLKNGTPGVGFCEIHAKTIGKRRLVRITGDV